MEECNIVGIDLAKNVFFRFMHRMRLVGDFSPKRFHAANC